MTTNDEVLVYSHHCKLVLNTDVDAIMIYRLVKEKAWSCEIVYEDGSSSVYEDLFASDKKALEVAVDDLTDETKEQLILERHPEVSLPDPRVIRPTWV
ncbi:hypothetical protein [Pseudobacteriovorax antillogorgiicola]|uniref:Uncharacterized protein n=1 Tax=Pseudobacteriovorax antillogorgiicola TaxID=1513793 RepID=A0A1Y6C5F8_9BACT|nr:hypothetical protein [Pseudobacteriovorax antillogorgiicola]TCS51173.1 hypothetical protein EDD56_11157 [Pseudobacteriovorax antillogorgiicola]SMF38009.1 hypothetical protein SAMN06296036_111121 [Pseudobacteriovorax antillogorgiicola]